VRQLLRFAAVEATCCLFAVLFFAGLAVTRVVPLPLAPYDALLLWCLVITAGLWWTGWESTREVGVIAVFHVVGLVLEVWKTAHGSWSYPGEAALEVGDVPLYSGFMYAAVGSYVCQAWRRLDLRVTGYRPLATSVVAALVYLNFFTSHVVADVRVPLAVALLLATWGTWVWFTVGGVRYRMPLALSFVLIGLFLWLAENAATLLGAWRYPHQESVWSLVHPGKLGSWSLLVVVSIVLVATVKAWEGRLYGYPTDVPTVVGRVPATPPDAPPGRAGTIRAWS
jgi:uncharacterized membrane protein YoaT (DUF817 family)